MELEEFLNNHPELVEALIKRIAETNPIAYFSKNIHDLYPQFGELAAKNVLKYGNRLFFENHLHKKYPTIILSIGDYK